MRVALWKSAFKSFRRFRPSTLDVSRGWLLGQSYRSVSFITAGRLLRAHRAVMEAGEDGNVDTRGCADVHIIPMREDNYSYLIVDRSTKDAACVDPYTPQKVLRKVEELGVRLTTCLTTHKHYDHADGNEELKELVDKGAKGCVAPLRMVASAYERVPGTTHPVQDGDAFSIGTLTSRVIHAPCHTRGHLLFYITGINNSGAPLLFTGDTLFIAGCGRFFEGGAEDMLRNFDRISSLPLDTRLFVGHEYTVKNLKFAETIEPDNDAVREALEVATMKRSKGRPTVPGVLKEELRFNPFMRTEVLQKKLKMPDRVSTMDEIRRQRNTF